jgi:hypothetical protein
MDDLSFPSADAWRAQAEIHAAGGGRKLPRAKGWGSNTLNRERAVMLSESVFARGGTEAARQ